MKQRNISREKLKTAYADLPVKEAAKSLGVSVVVFYRLIDEAGIERKRTITHYEIVD